MGSRCNAKGVGGVKKLRISRFLFSGLLGGEGLILKEGGGKEVPSASEREVGREKGGGGAEGAP